MLILKSVKCFTEELKFYVTFNSQEFLWMEEFLLLQSITTSQDFDDSQLSETTLKTDKDGNAKAYRIDILLKKIAGTSKSKLEKKAKVVFSIAHKNAGEESLFSWVRKNLILQRACLQASMEHCQVSCPSNWPDNMVNHAINMIHRLMLLKRLWLPLDKAHSSHTT